MKLQKDAAQKIEEKLKGLHPDFSTRIDPDTNQVSALIKGIKLGFDELLQLAHIAKERTMWFKRSGNKVGIYIS